MILDVGRNAVIPQFICCTFVSTFTVVCFVQYYPLEYQASFSFLTYCKSGCP